jgi:flagellar motor switch protein FliN/FliY
MDREILSQEELDALLRGATTEPEPEVESLLTSTQIDAIGEIGNITYGAASTTLSELLNYKVIIDAPTVFISTQQKIQEQHPIPYLIIEVDYKQGLSGSNVLIVKIEDASIIAALMMGLEDISPKSDLDQMELSAVGEAMNQMIGSASTSLAQLFAKKIQIEAPAVRIVDFALEEPVIKGSHLDEQIVAIAFKLQIGDLIDSEIMLLIPTNIAIELSEALITKTLQMAVNIPELEPEPIPKSEPVPAVFAREPSLPTTEMNQISPASARESSQIARSINEDYTILGNITPDGFRIEKRPRVPIQPAQFASLGPTKTPRESNSFGLLLDVPLNVVVELGTATLKIKEILDLVPGSIIELNKIAGDMVDVQINQRLVAKGEVVVIDENFGIKILDIVSPLERVNPNPTINK